MEIRHILYPTDELLVEQLILNLDVARKNFRYFETRDISVIQNHLVTLLALDENKPIGYGHLDVEDDNIWLGISIAPSYQGRGLGKKLMHELIAVAEQKKIPKILLSVDKDNVRAQSLYEFFKFHKKKEEIKKKFFIYELIFDGN